MKTIYPDSQVALKAASVSKSGAVLDCIKAWADIKENIKITLLWIPTKRTIKWPRKVQ